MVDVESFIDEKIEEISEAIGDANAIIALSGGVDSSTAAALAYEADRATSSRRCTSTPA